ncbi:MAG: 50S ribosomal protein L18e [Candidatus Woesearchaeota archaeon]|jgi:large subunit ribosomal protein L18e|nr:50S ribosomal protein L18e [Candidatus Woesearchaeota archaeon]MDP7467196.1 50S ribosomal protein L18e [Candidatus Woesearchaeota archaeon]MDP7647469.1 50S ribosomal protein L18e [Candidatus Woesearchaeota archaeon]
MQREMLIQNLKKKGNFWRSVASDLERSTRRQRAVNVSRINRHTKENDVIVVSGKVLGAGDLKHPITVGAYNFSTQAKTTIEQAKGKCVTLQELSEKYPDGKEVKVIG